MQDEAEPLFLKYLEAVESGKPPDTTQAPYNNPEFLKILAAHTRINRAIHGAGEELNPLHIGGMPDLPELEIVGEIGRGGMGLVFLARDTSLDREVAVKIIPKLNNEQIIKRFALESKILAKLNHPNIVVIHSHGQSQDHFYYVMEKLEGVTLNQVIVWLTENRFECASDVFKFMAGDIKTLPAENSAATRIDGEYCRKIVEIVRQASDALAFAHAGGVVHRDIKPSNLVFDKFGMVKILDFGISKIASPSQLTMPDEFVGTPYYVCPEMLHGREATPQADVYSLGVVLYELLSLTLPFDYDSIDALYSAIKEKIPARITAIRRELPRDLDVIVQTAMEKDPEHRYPDMMTLRADLEFFLGNKPLKFAKYSLWRTLAKHAHARRKGLAVGSLVMAAAVVAANFWITSLRSQLRERETMHALTEVRQKERTEQTRKHAAGAFLKAIFFKALDFHVGEKMRALADLRDQAAETRDPFIFGLYLSLKISSDGRTLAIDAKKIDADYDSAAAALLALQPDWLSARLFSKLAGDPNIELADLIDRTGHMADAAPAFEDNFLVGAFLLLAGDPADAAGFFKKSFESKRDFFHAKLCEGAAVAYAGRLDDGIAILQNDVIPAGDEIKLFLLAELFSQKNEIVKAKSHYDRLVGAYPESVFGFQYVNFLATHGFDDEAVAYVARRGDTEIKLIYLTAKFAEARSPEEGIRFLDEAFAIQPYPYMYSLKAEALAGLGKYDQAIETLKLVVDLNQKSKSDTYTRANYLTMMGDILGDKGDFSQARKQYREAYDI
ncbi:MAG: hypothetical protein A3G34_00650 [Candidatus Lindowbacteria bacterium RIFCSPLOWO2_12_FULL_62_27]|nr:MAG: hypothetical protein A3G34_00650 [Candidatus Lindowbacteria bacterium RIFCSPLOWO2_12_FULL_62_27]OGH58179.1 MAG: hypothetical protein A3I06_00900 [Candidatus Lindowbacteria bacterium RIFCSPLOWO2_02_FULL_62_12]